MPTTKKRAKLFLKQGEAIPIWVSDGFAVNVTDMTETTMHRFPVRGLMRGKLFVFVQGDRINFIEVEGS